MEELRYPIGRYEPTDFSPLQKQQYLNELRYLPDRLEAAILNLDAGQLETPYRAGGWNLRQVVHHVSDSHTQCLMRLKWALTENNPTIKPYNENDWAQTTEYEKVPINVSITQLHAIHLKLVALFNSLTEEDFGRTYVHPQYGNQYTIWYMLGLYAWHGKHHVAHITSLRERMNW